MKKNRKVLIILTIVHGLIILLYIGISIFFMNHYFWNTTIDGNDFSAVSMAETRNQLLNTKMQYELVLIGRNDLQDSILANDINMEYYYDDYLETIIEKHNGFAWPLALFSSQDYTIPKYVSYDQDLLVTKILNLSFFKEENMVLPQDAYITPFDNINMNYEIVPEIQGSYLQFEEVKKAVFKAVAHLETSLDLQEGSFYKAPEVLASDKKLQAQLQEMNVFVSSQITFQLGNDTEILDGKTISQWIVVDSDNVTLDETAVSEYVKEIASTYDTYGKDRKFTTTDGRVLTLKSGAYGWKTDKDGECKAVVEILEKGLQVTREPLYLKEGYVRGTNDIGNSYVEVDLANQHLYLYIDGVIIHECNVVSGNVSTGATTPPGVFGITYKQTDRVLVGEDYETHVNYWMPFNGSIGLHDATWRKKFGGDIYLTKGSHGCINLPYKSAKLIYDYIEENMPVICYYQ
jgi:hypothetical protein